MTDDFNSIPFYADAKTFDDWLSRRFTGVPRRMRTPVEIMDVFDVLPSRGNRRELWLDVLSAKVQQFRASGMTWIKATERALEEWKRCEVALPPVWQKPINQPVSKLVAQLKNRRASLADSGVLRVTPAHFYLAFMYGEFKLAAMMHSAAKSSVKKEIRAFVEIMNINSAR